MWGKFFKTEMKCFAPNKSKSAKDYEFSHMIMTDGIACSIVLVRKDVANMRFKPRFSVPKELYIDDVGVAEKLKGKTVVCCNTLTYTTTKNCIKSP